MKYSRLDEMEKYIQEQKTVTIPQLQTRFMTSINTVRRDVALLQKKGTVEKIYGGVRWRIGEHLTSFNVRSGRNKEAKEAIGKKAAGFVADGDIIFLDSGTTTLQMVDQLAHLKDVTLITHNLQAVIIAAQYPNIKVTILPGQLHRETSSFTGLETLRMLKSYNIRKAFMGATGLSLHSGISNSSSLEYELKVTAIERSKEAYLLLDNQKFGETALLTFASLAKFYGIITNIQPDASYIEAIRSAGSKLFIA